MKIYHHTKLDNLQSIFLDDGVCLRAYHYSKYRSGDYAWTKGKVGALIKKICLKNGYDYDRTDTTDPFILCFSNKGKSSTMWKKFGCSYKGIQIVLDKNIVIQYANKSSNPDVLMDCIYTNKINRMKSFLLHDGWRKYPHHTTNNLQGDLEEISAYIMKPKFQEENECRYIIPYHKVTHFSNGTIWDEEIKQGKYLDLKFPKDALIGINIGYKSNISISEVKSYLETKDYDLSKVSVNIFKP